MADVMLLAEKLERRVSDAVYPYSPEDYEDEIKSAASTLGYEDILELPSKLEVIVVMMAQVNMYYTLAGKHAQNHRVRIEGDMEIHPQQVAENYLKLALAFDKKVAEEQGKVTDSIEVLDATRWRVSDNRTVPRPNGGAY